MWDSKDLDTANCPSPYVLTVHSFLQCTLPSTCETIKLVTVLYLSQKAKYFSIFYFIYYCVYLYDMWECWCLCAMAWRVCRGQRTTFGSCFSLLCHWGRIYLDSAVLLQAGLVHSLLATDQFSCLLPSCLRIAVACHCAGVLPGACCVGSEDQTDLQHCKASALTLVSSPWPLKLLPLLLPLSSSP